jgi:hypothetical protein
MRNGGDLSNRRPAVRVQSDTTSAGASPARAATGASASGRRRHYRLAAADAADQSLTCADYQNRREPNSTTSVRSSR